MIANQAAEASLPQGTPRRRKPLGQRLLDEGLITEMQLAAALREQRRTGLQLGDALVSLGFITPETLAAKLARDAGANVVDLAELEPEPEAIERIPFAMAQRLRALPVCVDEHGELAVVMADPFDVVAVDTLEKESGMRLRVLAAPESDVIEAVDRWYAQKGSIDQTVEQIVEGTAGEDDESPMIRLANQIILQGVHDRATDIHIEPGEQLVRVRARVDGVLSKMALLPGQLSAGLTTRIKIMAGLDVAERRVPQDGRICFSIGRRKLDIRVSTLPTVHGESIVMRILDSNPKALSLDKLGMSDINRERFEALISRPHGIVLVTGPTGSGKTTTLYAALGRIDAHEKSIFTLEDPIEYTLPMIRQTQVNPDAGMTFASGLRALLRQDPDVILIGEMRDQETALLAVRAALTGHLVFSTLHTNDAIGAIPRLVDMGVEPYLLMSALNGVVAQRLLRRICPNCREEDSRGMARLQRMQLKLPVGDEGEITLWRGRGCEQCRGTGYAGRTAIHEVLVLDDAFHDALVRGANAPELRKLAQQSGMRLLAHDGLERALAGQTTLEEVLRVTRLETD